MKELLTRILKGLQFLFLNIFSLSILSQSFNENNTLKSYSHSTIITSQVRSEGNKAILRGSESFKNRKFVLENYSGIQMSVYPAWDNGFWPKSKPESVKDFSFNAGGLSELVNWGIDNKMYLLHHCLFFPNKYYPEWFWKSDYSKDELNFILKSYINSILISNDNFEKVDAFNVINEIFLMNRGFYRETGVNSEDVKWMSLGYEEDKSGLDGKDKINDEHPVFIRKVLEEVRSLSTSKLEIRDFNIAFGGHKSDGLYQLIKHLKNTGVPIDAVGFQCHLNYNVDYDYDDMFKNIKRFQALGVEVFITELDVGMNLWGGKGKPRRKVSDVMRAESDWAEYFRKQNDIYYNVIKTARQAGVTLISDWGFRDDVPYGNWRKDQKAWLLNKDYSKKEAFYSVLRALYETQKN